MSSMRSSAACRRVTSQYNSLYALRKTRVSPFHRLDVSTDVTRTARRVDEDADVVALISSRRARVLSARARLLVLMRLKTKKKSPHTVWSPQTSRASSWRASSPPVVVCASRAMGGASTKFVNRRVVDGSRDVTRARSVDPDARARSIVGTWRRAAEAARRTLRVKRRRVDAKTRLAAFGERKSRSDAKAWVMSSKVSEMCGFGRLRAIERGSKVRLIGGGRAAFVGDSGARRVRAFIAAMSDERADVSLKTKDERNIAIGRTSWWVARARRLGAPTRATRRRR